jgi:hypothetical protein
VRLVALHRRRRLGQWFRRLGRWDGCRNRRDDGRQGRDFDERQRWRHGFGGLRGAYQHPQRSRLSQASPYWRRQGQQETRKDYERKAMCQQGRAEG